MNDHKLMELAAKAVGMEYPHILKNGGRVWDPRTDDGDALRLAAELYLVVAVIKATHEKPAFTAVYHFNGPEHVTEDHGNNANAATRLAIVRAAAAIGETMCEK